ncbi:MAG: hypothetical protein RRA92_09875 [Gemmatimonadota bacterium]|nr:hypothetical protein [Gemmatimonadota bacterium]
MYVSRSKDFRVGCRIGSWDLERLTQLLGGADLISGLSVEMTDGSRYQLESAGELQEIENRPGRQVGAITIESAPPAFVFTETNPARLALVTVRNGVSDTIRYHVSGPARVVDRLARELDEWVTSLRPWYSSLAVMERPRFFLWSTAVVGTLALLVLAVYLTLGGTTGAFGASLPGRLARLAAAGGLAVVTATAAFLNVRLRRWLPPAEFHIGQGAANAKRLERRRLRLLRASVGAAVVAAAGSVAGAFLA